MSVIWNVLLLWHIVMHEVCLFECQLALTNDLELTRFYEINTVMLLQWQGHTELCQKTSSLCESWGWTLWTHLLCCGSDGLERTAWQHQRYGSVNPLLQTQSEDSSFLLLLAHQRIRGFSCMRYINPRLIDWLIDWLLIQPTRLSTVGHRAFPVAGSHLWDSLPPYVTSSLTLTVFCNRLKTHLFSRSFHS